MVWANLSPKGIKANSSKVQKKHLEIRVLRIIFAMSIFAEKAAPSPEELAMPGDDPEHWRG